MKWEALAAIGEIAGAIGVIVTLLFLIKQLRDNTLSVRSAAGASYMQAYSSVNGGNLPPEPVAHGFLLAARSLQCRSVRARAMSQTMHPTAVVRMPSRNKLVFNGVRKVLASIQSAVFVRASICTTPSSRSVGAST